MIVTNICLLGRFHIFYKNVYKNKLALTVKTHYDIIC